jgi:hypothetical protein
MALGYSGFQNCMKYSAMRKAEARSPEVDLGRRFEKGRSDPLI